MTESSGKLTDGVLQIICKTKCSSKEREGKRMALNISQRVVAGQSDMKIVAIVGTLGAGKTATGLAFAKALNDAGYQPTEVAYVVNEAGGTPLFDSSHATVLTLPNGCFTCQDEDELLEMLRQQEQMGVKLAIIEGFGLVSGDEVEEFLRKAGYSYQIVAVLDTVGFATNRLRYGDDMLASHVRVASGVILTKVQSGALLGDTSLSSVVEFVQNLRETIPVTVTYEKHPTWPSELTAVVLAKRFVASRHGYACGHGCSHPDHKHHHGDGDSSLVHGWRTFWLSLRATVGLDDLKQALGPWVDEGVLRLKGVAGGQSFNVAPGQPSWNESLAAVGSYAVLYLDETRCDISQLKDIVDLCAGVPEPARSFQLLRIDTDPEATNAEIERLLGAFDMGSPVIPTKGGLVTHPEEMQLLQQMARRPAMEKLWKLRVYMKCLYRWVMLAEFLEGNRPSFTDLAALTTNERELGVSLSWWADEYREKLPEALLEAVRRCKPAVLTARGVLALTQLRRDKFWRFWQVKEFERALAFPGEFTEEEMTLIAQAGGHLERLKAESIMVA